MANRIRRSALAVALAAAPMLAFAQDAAPEAPEAPTGWTGTGELGFALARGNARSENFNARLAFGRETEDWKHGWYAAALRAKGEVTGDFDGDGVDEERYELNANRYELGASSAYKFDDRNHISGSGRYENDDFSPYEYQATVALSYGRKLVDSERTKFLGEVGPGYRRARDAETGDIESDAILRGLLDFSHRLTDNTELFNKLLIEAGSDNTFAQNDFGVAVAMNESFALKAGLQLRHNTEVGADTRKTDSLTTINLVYSFR
ncbi:DUF481 domain-containing protein [Luteimonas arsenica]|uniref:DUF481 domain-containing protein n=1 Tax=Luteimonas arsenica TaxID=1586242 RepID=UPI001054C7ED|nr:DUF481 domain-containing protein [Luteimonas arsenica]